LPKFVAATVSCDASLVFGRICAASQELLYRLAEAAGLKDKIAAMASGKHINITEDRAVMHIALRAARDQSYIVDGKNVVPDVYAVLDAVREFSSKLRSGEWKVRRYLSSSVLVILLSSRVTGLHWQSHHERDFCRHWWQLFGTRVRL
jgi:hypothetical protein